MRDISKEKRSPKETSSPVSSEERTPKEETLDEEILEEEMLEEEIPSKDLTKKEKEEKEKKKRLLQEQLLREQQKQNAPRVLKSLQKVVAFPIHALSEIFAENIFIKAFLDASGIKKKPNYQKEIAENTAKIAKNIMEK